MTSLIALEHYDNVSNGVKILGDYHFDLDFYSKPNYEVGGQLKLLETNLQKLYLTYRFE